MTPRALTVLLTATFALTAAPAALAVPTSVGLDGTTLKVAGDNSAETYSVSVTVDTTLTGTVKVVGPAGFNGFAIPGCMSTSTSITCPTSVAETISLETEGGGDTINEDSSYPAIVLFIQGGLVGVDAGPGNDVLNANSMALNSLESGGEGDDTYNGLKGLGDQFQSGPGNDTYHGDAITPATPIVLGYPAPAEFFALDRLDATGNATGVTITLDDVANDDFGADGTDNVGADIEAVGTTAFDDTLTAGTGKVYFDAGAGNDRLTGSPQDDRFYSGAGDDTLIAGAGDDLLSDGDEAYSSSVDKNVSLPVAGNDTLDAGPGDDTVYIGVGADDVRGGGGEDLVVAGRYDLQVVDESAPGFVDPAPRYTPLTISLDDVANDGATGAGEGDNIHADVEDIDTGHRTDQLSATAADDIVTGNAAASRIITGGGKDTVDAGAGADVIDTGAGDDRVTAVDSVTDAIVCGSGTDSVVADLPGQDASRADALTDCEAVTGTPLPPGQTTVAVLSKPHRPIVELAGKRTLTRETFKKTRTLTLTVAADQAYSAKGQALAAGGHIAKVGDFVVGTGRLKSGTGKRTLKVKVAKAYVKRLMRTHKKTLRIGLAVTVSNAAGQSVRATRAYQVKG